LNLLGSRFDARGEISRPKATGSGVSDAFPRIDATGEGAVVVRSLTRRVVEAADARMNVSSTTIFGDTIVATDLVRLNVALEIGSGRIKARRVTRLNDRHFGFDKGIDERLRIGCHDKGSALNQSATNWSTRRRMHCNFRRKNGELTRCKSSKITK
jgi:hypothetical protein